MTGAKAIERWRGIFLPVLTIYDEELNLDLDATTRNVREIVERGAQTGNTVFLAVGAGGDFPMLTTQERKLVAEAVVEAVDGAAPVIVGCQETATATAIELAQHAEEIGAEGVQIGPPYYYAPSDDDVFEFFRAVNNAISIGIMAYNTWWCSYTMSLEFLERLLTLENVVSVKWSHPQWAVLERGYQRFAKRVAMVDNQGIRVYAHMLGATGFITHLGNFWPELEWETWMLLEQNQLLRAQALVQEKVWPWENFRAEMAALTGGEASAVKPAMDICGMTGGPVRPPSRPIPPEARERLRRLLYEMGAPVKEK